ncbi:MAG: SufS family cysteine desulfurase [Candidatus Micrarchaeota archaeon]|nr:SufS family cysteine desulfurase [Candidatus Micrarchaeota archaeon]
MIDVEKVRQDFPILKRKVNGKKIAYLDNAATTQKPLAVINAIAEYYKSSNANVHRSAHFLSQEATELYENARKKVAKFINADASEIIFVRNTTEALNAVATMACSLAAKEKRGILLSKMEHHSNIVPWQAKAKELGIEIDYAEISLSDWQIDYEDAQEKMGKQPFIFSFIHASNVLGSANDAKRLCKIAKKGGAYSCVDAAQSVPHLKVDVKEIGCDFLAFSGHKICGPMGIGVLYIRKELHECLPPFLFGGNMIKSVTLQKTEFAESTKKFEAGTQNVAGAIGLAAAIDYVQKIGMKNIQRHAQKLADFFAEEIGRISRAEVYGPSRKEIGLVSFNLKKIHAHDVAEFANQEAICIRAGHHCAQPLLQLLGTAASCRASFYLYNTQNEAERLVDAAKKCLARLG